MERNNGLYAVQGLNQQELDAIATLAQVCNAYEQLELKLNLRILHSRPKNETNDFLYYEDDLLVGYLALYCFNSLEAEVSGMVLPTFRRQGIFTRLFEAARKECEARKLPSMLWIVEHASCSGQAFAAALQTQFDHSEYKMILAQARTPSYTHLDFEFRPALPTDLTVLTSITAQAFGMSEQDVDWYNENSLTTSGREYYVGVIDTVCIGKIDINYNVKDAYIYGFAVIPEYQGRGYGRQILIQAIQAIQASQVYQSAGSLAITLEVATENEHALALYISCGFKQTSRYDYYRLGL